MTPQKGKDILSADLDIFGESAGEATQDEGNEYDIFGGAADSSSDSSADTATDSSETSTSTSDTETTASDSTESADTSASTGETTSDSDADNTTGQDETLDIDVAHLFDDLENKTQNHPELEQLIDSLRSEISTLTTDRNVLQKENATINERLMWKVGDDASLGMYKWVISNLEANPKLMMLAKHLSNADSGTMKNKMVSIVSDMLYDLTGEDVSDLINKDQSSKILSVTGKSSNSSAPTSQSSKNNEEPMSYEDSISKLF